MAIKYLDAKRLQGTNAERLALATTPQTNATSWKLIDRSSTLESVGSGKNIRVPTSSGSFTAKDNMMIITNSVSEGSMTQFDMNFNEDFNTNYWWNLSTNASSGTSQDDTWWIGLGGDDGSSDNHCFSVTQLKHIASKDKVGYTDGCFAQVGSANVPSRRKVTGKWTPSSSTAITDITYSNMNGASGSMSSGEVLVLGCDDDEADSGTNFWTQLGEHTLTADGSLDVSFTPKKYMMFEINTFNNSSDSSNMYIRFNGEDAGTGGSQYCKRQNAGAALANEETLSNENAIENPTYTGSDDHKYVQSIFCNETGQEKLGTGQSTGNSGTADDSPRKMEFAWKWIGSAQVSRITVTSASNPYGAGSSIRVWGSD